MKTKHKILLVLLVVLAAGLWYAYREYNRPNADLSNAKADVTITATAFISAFEMDSASASNLYIDKTILITGIIKSIDTSGVISLGDADKMSSVQCTMDKRYPIDYTNFKEGLSISIKGKCSGYETQDLLGTDVKMNFCIIANKK